VTPFCRYCRVAAALLAATLLAAGAAAEEPAETLPAPDPLFGELDPLFDDPPDDEDVGSEDPLEELNRGILGFNRQLDRFILDPVTRAYRFVVPDAVRRAVRRAFLNVGSAPVAANELFQLEWVEAGTTISRFDINSTVGIGGLFDPAARIGLERHEADFGQTLTLAGVPSGPYLVLPFFGPSSVRDGAGQVTDTFMNPSTYFFGFALMEQLIYGGSAGLTTREAHFEELKALESSSVDFYSALRSAFVQNRDAMIWQRREHRRHDWATPTVY
jgi:phospholipid-binding lipoprotein MlaA